MARSVAASSGELSSLLERRRRAERSQLLPIRLILVGLVIVSVVLGPLRPGLSGQSLWVVVCLVVFVVGILAPPRWRGVALAVPVETIVFVVVGAAGVGLAALQSQAASELPASATIFMAAIRLPRRWAAAMVVPVTAGLAVAIWHSAGYRAVAATVLLCIVLGVVGSLLQDARRARDRNERLLTELNEARDAEALAAAAAERASIARELHDVLAHSLSGLAIQLEGARKLAEVEGATDELRGVIDRSAGLARAGLVEARRAVGALREPDVSDRGALSEVVDRLGRELGVPVTFGETGDPGNLSPEVHWALSRIASEAVTNVARHAPGAATEASVEWGATEVHLRVVNGTGPADGAAFVPPSVPGGGWGVVGIYERVSRLGGKSAVGPNGAGWAVDVVVPR